MIQLLFRVVSKFKIKKMKVVSYFESELLGDIVYDGRLAKGTIYHNKTIDGEYDVYEDEKKVYTLTSKNGSMLFHYKSSIQHEKVLIELVSKKGCKYSSLTRSIPFKYNPYTLVLTVALFFYSIIMTILKG